MRLLLAITLVAAVTADVSHLLSNSGHSQNDGYHYAKPIGGEIFQAHAASAPFPSYETAGIHQPAASNQETEISPVADIKYESGDSYQAPIIPAVIHQPAASNQENKIYPVANVAYENGAHYQAPIIPYVRRYYKSGYHYDVPLVPLESRPPIKKVSPPQPPPPPPSPPKKYHPPASETRGYSYYSNPKPSFSF